MKKAVLCLVLLLSSAYAQAQTGPGPTVSCTDIPHNLSRGMETGEVFKLQQFLYAKGLLKAVPNGYYGPGTYAGVRLYQIQNKLSAVGAAGPLTRATIKQETCKPTTPKETFIPIPGVAASSTPVISTQATTTSPVLLPTRPKLDTVDLVTLFEGGETDWTFNLNGSNFAKEGNMVFFRLMNNSGKTYTIGTLPSADGKTIALPKNLTATEFTCGTGCKERLPAGKYEVTVMVFGAEPSDPKTLEVKPFTISATTGALLGALSAEGSNQRFGQLAFSTPESVRIDSVTLVTASSTISSNGITSIAIKDELTGSAFSLGAVTPSYQSTILGAYVSTKNTKAGDMWSYFSIEIYDYIGKKKTKFKSGQFLVTVAGVI